MKTLDRPREGKPLQKTTVLQTRGNHLCSGLVGQWKATLTEDPRYPGNWQTKIKMDAEVLYRYKYYFYFYL